LSLLSGWHNNNLRYCLGELTETTYDISISCSTYFYKLFRIAYENGL
jgi:hypothetical protein